VEKTYLLFDARVCVYSMHHLYVAIYNNEHLIIIILNAFSSKKINNPQCIPCTNGIDYGIGSLMKPLGRDLGMKNKMCCRFIRLALLLFVQSQSQSQEANTMYSMICLWYIEGKNHFLRNFWSVYFKLRSQIVLNSSSHIIFCGGSTIWLHLLWPGLLQWGAWLGTMAHFGISYPLGAYM